MASVAPTCTPSPTAGLVLRPTGTVELSLDTRSYVVVVPSRRVGRSGRVAGKLTRFPFRAGWYDRSCRIGEWTRCWNQGWCWSAGTSMARRRPGETDERAELMFDSWSQGGSCLDCTFCDEHKEQFCDNGSSFPRLRLLQGFLASLLITFSFFRHDRHRSSKVFSRNWGWWWELIQTRLSSPI